MAVRLEFINLLVPIDRIDARYPGGFAGFCRDNQALLGGRLWHDGYLLRDGAMSPADMHALVEFWKAHGLEPFAEGPHGQVWQDMCVVEALAGGPTLPCSWVAYGAEEGIAYHRDHDLGDTVGREEMQERYGKG